MRDEHVLRLDVSVDDTARVGVGDRGGEGEADLEDLLVGELVRADQRRERVAVDELGDEVEVLARRARLVQRDDRGMGQAGGGERLTLCPLAAPGGAQCTRLTATSR